MCAILSPEIFLAMIKYLVLPILCLLCYSNLVSGVPSQNNFTSHKSESILEVERNFSDSQLFIKVVKGIEFELNEDQDIRDYLNIQKMLFELHKLVRESDIISVKRPSLQLTSYNNNIYVFEFESVNDLNNLLKQVESLHFIESVRRVPAR